VRSDEKPLYVGCGIKESRLPSVIKISGVNEQLGITKSPRIAPRQEAVSDDVADEQINRSANDPALHKPNEKELSYRWRERGFASEFLLSNFTFLIFKAASG